MRRTNMTWIIIIMNPGIFLTISNSCSDEEGILECDLVPNIKDKKGFRFPIYNNLFPNQLYISEENFGIFHYYIWKVICDRECDFRQLVIESDKIIEKYKENACLRVFYFFSEAYDEIISIIKTVLGKAENENSAIKMTVMDIIEHEICFIDFVVIVTNFLIGIEVFLDGWATKENSFCFKMFIKYEEIINYLYVWFLNDESLYVLKEKVLFYEDVYYLDDNNKEINDRRLVMEAWKNKSKDILVEIEFMVGNSIKNYEIARKETYGIELMVEKINGLYSLMREFTNDIKKYKYERENIKFTGDFLQELIECIAVHKLDSNMEKALINEIKTHYPKHAADDARFFLDRLNSKYRIYDCLNGMKLFYLKNNFITNLKALNGYKTEFPEAKYISEDVKFKLVKRINNIMKNLLEKILDTAIKQIIDFYTYKKKGKTCFLADKEIMEQRKYILDKLLSDESSEEFKEICECLDFIKLSYYEIQHICNINNSIENVR